MDDKKKLGSTIQWTVHKSWSKRVQLGWGLGWMSGVICDRRLSAREKGKAYKMVVRPAMV